MRDGIEEDLGGGGFNALLNDEVYDEWDDHINNENGTEEEEEEEEEEENLLKKLKEGYSNPGSNLFFLDSQSLYKFFRGKLSKKIIEDFLSSQDGYTLNRPSKRLKTFNMTYVRFRR